MKRGGQGVAWLCVVGVGAWTCDRMGGDEGVRVVRVPGAGGLQIRGAGKKGEHLMPRHRR